MRINNYKHIIWDWNGTLLNDVEFCKNIINRILQQNKLEKLSINKYRSIFTFPVEKYYEAAGLDFSKTPFDVLGKDFITEYEEKKLSCDLFPGAISILNKIKQKGIKQSVLSAYKEDNLIDILTSYNLKEYFNYIVGSDNIYAGGKLHLGLFLIEKLECSVNEILFIGDTMHDDEVAKVMNVNSILIADGHQAKDKLSGSGALVLDSVIDLDYYLFDKT